MNRKVSVLVAEMKDYILRNVCELYPELDVTTVEPCIYYMNGNDGTDFDWEANGRTCEFFVWYKTTELGLVKAYLTTDGYFEGYLWKDEGRGRAINLGADLFTREPEEFKDALEEEFDEQGVYDEVVGSITF